MDQGIDRTWIQWAIRALNSERQRAGQTRLLKLDVFGRLHVDLYARDETQGPTRSLKDRLAGALILFGLCSGRIGRDSVLLEASSGSTAIADAYLARLLGLRFIAVVPTGTSAAKIEAIKAYGGEVLPVAGDISAEADRVAMGTRGACNLRQFADGSQALAFATEPIVAEILRQMRYEQFANPEWFVCGAGTGSTAAYSGRWLLRYGIATRLCVADPTGGAFAEAWERRDRSATGTGSVIEGIARPKIEPGMVLGVVDHAIAVPDAAAIATMRWFEQQTGLRVGGSTGVNLWASFELAKGMFFDHRPGSIATIICDQGNRYRDTLGNDVWLADKGLDIEPYIRFLEANTR